MVENTAEPEMLSGRMRTVWQAREGEAITYTGTDFIEFGADGRISRVTMFFDSEPD